MKYKTIVLVPLLIIIAVLSVVAYKDYTYRTKTTTKQASVAVNQLATDKAVIASQKLTLDNQSAQITEQTTEQGHFCSVLAAHKLPDALCPVD